jgi:hypothetical protein
MKITNQYGLPEVLVKAIENDKYDGGHGDISVTKLIAPAYQAKLVRENYAELSEDVSDRIWALQGQSIHHVIERAAETLPGCISEERFYAEVDGKVVSAQIDLLYNKRLTDFKLTSVYSIKDFLENGKEEFDAQVNIQRYLLERNGIEVKVQDICAMARDWRKMEAYRDPKYPPKAVAKEVNFWSTERIEQYIKDRIKAHYSDNPEPCTKKETWEKPETYALMKTGRKSAVKVEPTLESLKHWAAAKGLYDPESGDYSTGHSVDVRKGSRPRCADYCSVSHICPEYKKYLDE